LNNCELDLRMNMKGILKQKLVGWFSPLMLSIYFWALIEIPWVLYGKLVVPFGEYEGWVFKATIINILLGLIANASLFWLKKGSRKKRKTSNAILITTAFLLYLSISWIVLLILDLCIAFAIDVIVAMLFG
jgi:hypothetical protein